MSNTRIVGRVAAVIAPAVGAMASLMIAPAIAWGRPNPCADDICPPPPPRIEIDHSDIGTGGGQYPAQPYPGNYNPDYSVCVNAANPNECINSGPH